MLLPKTDLGMDFGPFCMAFIFTKDGTKILTGNMDRICEHAATWPLCHGMVHIYSVYGIGKAWRLFGRDHARLSLLKERVGKRMKYALRDGQIVLRTWRKLPSCYLEQFASYRPPLPMRLRGGLE